MRGPLPPGEASRLLAAALAACGTAGAIHRRHFRSDALAVEMKSDASPVTPADRASEEAIRETLHRAAPGLGLLGEEFGAEGSARDRWIIDPIDATKNFVAGLPFFATLIGLELDGELVLGVVHAPALGPGAGLGASPAHQPAEELGETWWAVRGEGAFAGTGTTLATCKQRRLQVATTSRIESAFIAHGGLNLFRRRGLWDRFSLLIDRAYRTRGFGDWWGHMLVAEGRCDAMVEAQVALHDVAAIVPIIEEAGGVFLTRGGAPLVAGFAEAVLSATPGLGSELQELLQF
jgi:histidinol-phosphatase